MRKTGDQEIFLNKNVLVPPCILHMHLRLKKRLAVAYVCIGCIP